MESLVWYKWYPIPNYVVSLLIVTFSFLAYWIVQHFTEQYAQKGEKQQAKSIVINRLAGFILFFPIALLLYGLNGEFCLCSLGGYLKFKPDVWLVTAILSCVAIVVNWFAARSNDNLVMYPQIRLKEWSFTWLLISALTWILYLIGYEFIFRSLLLFTWLNALGAPTAIALNICIYALVHLPKGLKETLGSIPMGLILCLLVMAMHSFWPAVFLHASLALSNEWFSFHYQPFMRLKTKR